MNELKNVSPSLSWDIEWYMGCREKPCFSSWMGWFANNFYEWCFLGSKTQTNCWKLSWINHHPLLASVSCDNMTLRKHLYWYIFLIACPQNVSNWATYVFLPLSSWLYYSLIITADSSRFHLLACKKVCFINCLIENGLCYLPLFGYFVFSVCMENVIQRDGKQIVLCWW